MKQIDEFTEIKLPRWNDLPELELYIDQVVAVISQFLNPAFNQNELIITPTMINNYTKKSIAPKPVKKRYNKTHLACFMVITIMKSSFTLPEIRQAMDLQLAKMDAKAAYDYFCEVQEAAFVLLIEGGELEPYCKLDSKSGLAVFYGTLSFASKWMTNQMIYEEIEQSMEEYNG